MKNLNEKLVSDLIGVRDILIFLIDKIVKLKLIKNKILICWM